MPPAAVHENAWGLGSSRDCVVELAPTTCPASLTAIASLLAPPGSVPRSTIPPACVHENAWLRLGATVKRPTNWPVWLTARTSQQLVPRLPSGPRSTVTYGGPAARPAPPSSATSARATAASAATDVTLRPCDIGATAPFLASDGTRLRVGKSRPRRAALAFLAAG